MSQEKEIAKTSSIHFDVHLNQEKIPAKIDWQATDSPITDPQECKAIMLNIWDGEAKNALRIDLWTEEMTVEEMNHFFFQCMHTMADTFLRATGNTAESQSMKAYAKEFAKRNEVIG